MNDMARYLQFHLNIGNVDGKQIVPQVKNTHQYNSVLFKFNVKVAKSDASCITILEYHIMDD